MSSDTWRLPTLVDFNLYGGDWAQYLGAVYEVFRQDFVESSPVWPSRRWALKRHPLHAGKEATFWHIIQEGDDESTRIPSLRRCERIRWPRKLIDSAHSGRVRHWTNHRNGETRILLATEDFSYVVVLADRETYVMLWTAFPVEKQHRREKLQKEYEKFMGT